jgi:Restriction endonuclease XhoI
MTAHRRNKTSTHFRRERSAVMMPIVRVTLPSFEDRLRAAIAHYWKCLDDQAAKQSAGVSPDGGRRSALKGGKQMAGLDEFCNLINWLVIENGLAEARVYVRGKRELPAFFRPTKEWDMLVVHERHLVAALEFNSQRGPSSGSNFNDRTDEALGNANDFWAAYRKGTFGSDRPRPWLGWVMLLEDCPKSRTPVSVAEPHFPVFPEFQAASYAKRYELLLRRVVMERLYDGAAFMMATEARGRRGRYTEPAADLSMRRFLVGLAGHVATYVSSI